MVLRHGLSSSILCHVQSATLTSMAFQWLSIAPHRQSPRHSITVGEHDDFGPWQQVSSGPDVRQQHIGRLLPNTVEGWLQ
jgi:hypothetical protein